VSIEQQQTQTQIPVIQFDTLLVLMVIKKQKPLEKKIKIVDKYFGVAPLLHAHKQNKPGQFSPAHIRNCSYILKK
jgi:hypothetical protein